MRVGKVEIPEDFANLWIVREVERELLADILWIGESRDGTRTICATHPEFDDVGANDQVPFYNVVATVDHPAPRTRKETWRFERAKMGPPHV